MEDKENSTPVKGKSDFDGTYFKEVYENSQGYFRGSECSPERQGELVVIAEEASELSPAELEERFNLSLQEGHLVGFFSQVKREIDLGVAQGNLTAEEADEWREKFGFKKKELTETEA